MIIIKPSVLNFFLRTIFVILAYIGCGYAQISTFSAFGKGNNIQDPQNEQPATNVTATSVPRYPSASGEIQLPQRFS